MFKVTTKKALELFQLVLFECLMISFVIFEVCDGASSFMLLL